MSQIDKRIKVNTIIENQLPEFVVADFPNASEFFKQYYLSQEFQGGPIDLITNFDQYLKSDNLVPEVIVGVTSITSSITSSDTTISVSSTRGFPSEYGLLKINDEIISYTGITSTSFTGCIRGFSGVSGYNVGVSSSLLEINREKLIFEDTTASDHTSGTSVTNLSVLFLQEFFKKLKKTFLPGFDNNDFASNLDVGNFIKFSRSFYQSKGIEESIKILFKVLYGVESRVLDLEGNLVKPSDAEFIRREVIVADLITETGNPQDLVGQTIFKSTDLNTNASVSEVEILQRNNKIYYKISLFIGFSDRDLIEGIFTIPGKTKVLTETPTGSSIISVDSTVGFGTTGTILSGQNIINYTSKSINQFFGCTGVGVGIGTADDIRDNETIFGYENGDLSKRVDLRITGVLSEFETVSDVNLVNEGELIFVKNVGEKIENDNSTYKEKFANSWKYNTSSRFEVDISGTTFSLRTKIDKSKLKKGDLFQILRRGEQVVEITGQVGSIDENLNQFTALGIAGFVQDSNESYDIRRIIETASSSGVEIETGNNTIITDVLNVYTDSDVDGYVASNSLPNYDITVNKVSAATSSLSLEGYNTLTETYSFINFPLEANQSLKFIQGDAVTYIPDFKGSSIETLSGIESGRTYYIDPIIIQNQNITKVALYESLSQVGTASTVQIGIGTTGSLDHNFTLKTQANKKLTSDKILRKIPLSQNLFVSSKHESPVNDIGILRDGVQIRSPISDDNIFFGPLESIDVLNSGDNYDVINPPVIDVSSITGTKALVEPVIKGNVKEIIVDPQEFDIEAVNSISLTGGNGSGCKLNPVVGIRYRTLNFDSRNIFFGGGIDTTEETITFKKNHNLENGQLIYYNSNGNPPIATGTAFDGTQNITGALSDGDPYFVRIINPSTVRLFNSKSEALFSEDGAVGVNTVGLATDTVSGGNHKFRTESVNTLFSVKIINPGEGYTHRKLRVEAPSGISTSYDTINFVNHGFESGEIVNYSNTLKLAGGGEQPNNDYIGGLNITDSYIIKKIDDDSFKLANAGVGGTSTSDYDRNKFVNLTSVGVGYHIFKYPDISVDINVSYSSTVTGNITLTPIVTGEITEAYLYENGTDYGSKILNHHIEPTIKIKNGNGAALKPVISEGRIEEVSVVNKGKNYNSLPDIEITDTFGTGAKIRPVIENGKVISTIVINSGIGYSSFSTLAKITPRGSNAILSGRIRPLTVNGTKRFGNFSLTSREDSLTFGVFGYSQQIAKTLEESFSTSDNGEFNQITSHSPIIGWAYDGNPIYGPFGYSDPNNINSDLKIVNSSYILNSSNLLNRPSGFDAGFFIEDYTFNASGDLDIHNGRFCKTPEFPNGIYAYFASVGLGAQTNKLEEKYPYFIGKSFRSPLINDNLLLDHDFDFNSSNLLRNTLPHNIDEKFGDNDFIIESNETIRQSTEVQSVSQGTVDDIVILEGGTGYKVGDVTNFDNEGTNGSGFSAEVSEIVGIDISRLDTSLERFEDISFVWKNNNEVVATNFPFMEMNDQDSISISGLSTTIVNLTGSFNVGVKTDRIGLAKSMTTGSVAGKFEDIVVTNIPNTISIGGSLRVGSGNTTDTEVLRVLGLYNQRRIIRVLRHTGIAHTLGSNVDVLNTSVTIPVKTQKFDSKLNDLAYFNGKQSVGVGTTAGGGISVDYWVGDLKESLSIPTRTIHIPNHPFKTGQKVSLNKRTGSAKFGVSDNGEVQTFQIPLTGQSMDVYIVDKGQNFVGLLTTKVGIGSTSEGLFFHSNGTQSGIGSGSYFLSSQFEQITGDLDKVTTIVSTNVAAANTSTHGLQNSDIVKMNVVPNLAVGIGTTTPITVKFNSEYQKLLLNSVTFAAADVETNRIDIDKHGLITGDKIFYQGSATGLSEGSYFVNRINDRYFQLAETSNDLYSTPPKIISITANTGGSNQSVSLINPKIKSYKNSKLTFNLADSSLSGYEFKVFYDKNLTNQYFSSQDSTNFNLLASGTTGTVGAALTVNFSTSTPDILHYGISKGGYISTSDTDVVNGNEIIFVDSIYSGEYRISGVTTDKFNISPKMPEFTTYLNSECEKLEYSTKSTLVKGTIKNFKILSSGYNYKKLPKFKSITSDNGVNANITSESKTIGRIKDVRIIDIGYEYASDKTLSPEALVSPVLEIDNLDVIESIEIVSGGSDYINAPDLLVFNPITNTLVDNSSLVAITPNQTISEVKVLAPVSGLDSINHQIISINNSNGVGINSIETSNSGVVTCYLETPFNGFVDPQPFVIGDEIFVEGIQQLGETGVGATQGGISTVTTLGDGFNSENYNYQFFEVEDYISGVEAIVKFNLAGLTTNPGIAKTFQSGYAVLVNKNKYPDIRPIQTRGVFQLNENLAVDSELTDLRIVEIRDDFIKVDGKFNLKLNDRITGKVSGITATVTKINGNKAKFKVDFSNRKEYGWIDDIGKLNTDYQVIPDNDYYQNLSYTVKSTIAWEKFVNPVNRLVHPSGLKNFADTSIESQVNVGIGTTAKTNDTITLDVLNILELNDSQRVDAINNFDFSLDYDSRVNKSKFLELSNKTLSDFTRCKTNRVLIHDDVSNLFSSTGFQSNDSLIESLIEDYGNYLIQIVDPDTFDTQFSELIVLTTEDDAFLLEKSKDFTTTKLGDFSTEILESGIKNLIFDPIEEFTKDHDIKVLKIDFNTDLVGINTNSIGNIDLTGLVSIASSASSGVVTSTIAEFPKTDFNGLYANIFVQDSLTKEINYNEIIVDFDGTDTTVSQAYFDSKKGLSNSAVGIITARFENDLIKIQCENSSVNQLDIRSNIVGLGTTTAGIGTHRFSVAGQPSGAERSLRLESGYVTGTASTITYNTINKTVDSTVKSLVRVSCGKTSAIHQVITIRDADDVLTVQYPFVSSGSTTGIGTFGGEIVGNDINLRFYPDSEFNSLIEVQSYNQIFYTENDFGNTPPNLNYGPVSQQLFLTSYDGKDGKRADKKEFELKYEGIPIYSKTFDPTNAGILSTTTGIFTIPDHFFNTGEELTYTPSSTFIGIAATAVSIGATANMAGIVTTILPSTVFAKITDKNNFRLFTRPEYVTSGSAVTFTGTGAGNAHKLSMSKGLTKTLIGLDGVVQQPVTFTRITHTLDGNIGAATSQFVMSGISSVQPSDILKIDDEFMTITEVGFSSISGGKINDATDVALGLATLPTVRVERGQLGISASTHADNASVKVHRGSFNIVDSKVIFTNPPKGNTRSRRNETNLPFVKADFSGRTFLRSNYTTNMLFDDLSDSFTGIGKTYNLTVGGANTSSGIGVGNGVLFINGVFQTPLTTNNVGNNYEFISDTTAGISTVQFTGITSENGQFIISNSDINQNQVPRGGLIVSLGSTTGLGYAPLQGAKVKAFKNTAGGLTSIVGIGTSSGFNLGVQTAVYSNTTGIITVTTNEVHGFGLERPNTVKLKNLEFSCVGYSGVTTTFFQDHERGLFVVGIVSDRTFEVQAGPSTIVHTYQGGGVAYEFFEDLTFGSGYRGGSVAIGVTDQAYVHRFVSAGIGSIRKSNFAGTQYTATDAVYTSHTGTLLLTIPSHGLTTSDTVGIDTGGLVFKCSKDNFFSDHPYPRSVSKTSFPNSDPIAGIQTSIISVTTDTILLNVGAGGGAGTGAEISAIVGAGGTLAFTIDNAGSGYVNPEIIIPEPNYDNLPVIGISRLGVGPTTDTGSNLLLDVEVSAASTTVGIGSTLFEISNFKVARDGHSFKVGDKFKPVGLITASHLSSPINEFELEVIEIFNDKFSAWQFGEIDFIDSIKNLQDGSRLRFPLYFNGQLLSFEKDDQNVDSQQIDLDAVLLIFVNGVLQKPGESYFFQGGTTFVFKEAPTGETFIGANDDDKVDIFFYKGQDGVDVDIVDVQETVKIGDQLRVMKSPLSGITTSQQNERVIKEILSADLVETDIYSGRGVDEINEKPVRWTKQKTDIIVGNEVISKSRSSIEPQVYPTAKIIGNFSVTSGIGAGTNDGIFVDDVNSFFYEVGNHIEAQRHVESLSAIKYNISINAVDALVSSGEISVGAAATAIVSAAGTISSINVTSGGSGYSGTVDIGISAPSGVEKFVGIGTTATATATVTNGSISNSDIDILNPGLGYTFTNPPSVVIGLPEFQTEKITSIDNVQGFSGIITGIAPTTNGGQTAIKFFFRAEKAGTNTNDLAVGYPILISDTRVGNGVVSVDTANASVVGIGTTFLDNIYIVHARNPQGNENGEIICNVQNGSSLSGITTTGFYNVSTVGLTTSLGRLSWGRLYNASRDSSPISIGVTGFTVNSGLTTFPTIQRKHYSTSSLKGLRSSGAIRVFGL